MRLLLLFFAVLMEVRLGAPEPTVWAMQVLVPDLSTVAQKGFVDLNGRIVVNSDHDVDILLSGLDLENVTHVVFTTGNSSRGVRDYFCDDTSKFIVKDNTKNTARTRLNFGKKWSGKNLHLLLLTSDQQLGIFQGIQLSVEDLSSLFLPVWIQIPVIILLLCLSSLFSGLNLGLMSLDKMGLKILIECGSESEKHYAKAIEPLRKHGNYLLCTLLLGNVLVNTTLTLLLDQIIGSGIMAVVFSTLAIVTFGEILPQAVCSRYGLMVGARTRFVTIIFMALTGAISWPLSKLLDCVLGQEIGTLYNRDKLSKLVEVQRAAMDIGDAEVDMLTGVLRMRNKKAEDIMTPIEDVFMVSYDAVLDFNILNEIFTRGFSRIPVYDGEKTNVVNVLNVKDIAFLDPDDKVPLKAILKMYAEPPSPVVGAQDREPTTSFSVSIGTSEQTAVALTNSCANCETQRNAAKARTEATTPGSVKQHDANLILRIENDMALDRLLQRFLEKRCHMSFVFRTDDTDPARDPVHELIGLVTLEDLFEEIIQREILDEGDVQDRRGNVVKRRRAELREFNAPGPVSLSPVLHLAAYQFLSTTELFHPDLVSQRILMRLLKHKLVEEHDYIEYNTTALDYMECNDRNFIYRPERGVDYFVLILQGHADVQVGCEGMKFDGGPFQVFGEQALTPINELLTKYPKLDIRQLAKLVQALPKYKTDYKVRASTDLQYVRVDRATYLALRTRTNQIKQLPTTTTAQAIAVETEELILKDVEIAKNPDIISQSPTFQASDFFAHTSDSRSSMQKPSTVAARTESLCSASGVLRSLSGLRANSRDVEPASTNVVAPSTLSKTGKTFMKSRNSVVTAPTGVGLQPSPNSGRRISAGDVTVSQGSASDVNQSAVTPLKVRAVEQHLNEARSSNNGRLSRPESLPNAVDCYVNPDAAVNSLNERLRLMERRLPQGTGRKPRSRTVCDCEFEVDCENVHGDEDCLAFDADSDNDAVNAP